jgi:predicted outer membrane lipoprotein
LFFAQIVGSIAASGLIVGLFPAPANVRTTLSEGLSIPRGLFIEAFLTAELVFTVLMLAKEKHKATFIAPVGIGKTTFLPSHLHFLKCWHNAWGLSLFIAELVGVYWTGGSLNPARSIGPCIVTWTWDKTHWIYWVGPLLGSLLAISFYAVIKALEYELANPGQDSDNIDSPSPEQNLQTRQQEVRRRLMEALGYDIVDQRGSGEYDLERLGYQKPVLSLYPKSGDGGRGGHYAAGGGNAPHFGPLGTTIRNSGEMIQGDRMSLRDMGYESGSSGRKKSRRGN